jgi:hypothetical protein
VQTTALDTFYAQYGLSATDAQGAGLASTQIRGAQHLAIATESIAVTEALLGLEVALLSSN